MKQTYNKPEIIVRTIVLQHMIAGSLKFTGDKATSGTVLGRDANYWDDEDDF